MNLVAFLRNNKTIASVTWTLVFVCAIAIFRCYSDSQNEAPEDLTIDFSDSSTQDLAINPTQATPTLDDLTTPSIGDQAWLMDGPNTSTWTQNGFNDLDSREGPALQTVTSTAANPDERNSGSSRLPPNASTGTGFANNLKTGPHTPSSQTAGLPYSSDLSPNTTPGNQADQIDAHSNPFANTRTAIDGAVTGTPDGSPFGRQQHTTNLPQIDDLPNQPMENQIAADRVAPDQGLAAVVDSSGADSPQPSIFENPSIFAAAAAEDSVPPLQVATPWTAEVEGQSASTQTGSQWPSIYQPPVEDLPIISDSLQGLEGPKNPIIVGKWPDQSAPALAQLPGDHSEAAAPLDVQLITTRANNTASNNTASNNTASNPTIQPEAVPVLNRGSSSPTPTDYASAQDMLIQSLADQWDQATPDVDPSLNQNPINSLAPDSLAATPTIQNTAQNYPIQDLPLDAIQETTPLAQDHATLQIAQQMESPQPGVNGQDVATSPGSQEVAPLLGTPAQLAPPALPTNPAVSTNPALPPKNPLPIRNPAVNELPDWWKAQLADHQRPNANVRTITLTQLIDAALRNSPRIRTIQRSTQIQETEIDRAKSKFDPLFNLDTKYTDTKDPVGNTLTTGGAPFLEQNTWNARGGLTKKFMGGANMEMYQRLGFENSNSNFFTPQDQGTATFGIDVNMPLMQGSGAQYNESSIVIAELQSNVSWQDYQAELQSEIGELGTLYWNLENARVVYIQLSRSLERANEILAMLKARVNYDTSLSQIALAQAEVSLRKNELQNAMQTLRELEISIRERIGDPDFEFVHDVEFIPAEFQDDIFVQELQSLNSLLNTAFENRFELERESISAKVADRQVFVSRCLLAPKLDMVFGVYTSGLEGDSGIEQAWQNQFGSTTPGYYGGFEYELARGRRNAKAELRQAQLRKMQANDAYKIMRNEIIGEVEKAYTRLNASLESRETAWRTVIDMRTSLDQLQRRWEDFAFIEGGVMQGATPSLALDQLLQGQRRLTDAENRLSLADLNVALARQRILTATGRLLETTQVPSPPTTGN